MQEEVSPESMGKPASSAVGEPAQRETGHFRNYWEHCGTKSAKALHRKAVRGKRAGIGKSKRKSRLSTSRSQSRICQRSFGKAFISYWRSEDLRCSVR